MMFQSTPVIANGRISNGVALTPDVAGFNPRPLLLTGESNDAADATGSTVVSIHARYC